METTTIAIADDQTDVRRGIREMLEAEPDLAVVGEAASGLEAIRLVGEVKPEVLVLDLALGDISGFKVATSVREKSPMTKVVIFSIHGGRVYILKARQVGARGYVPKRTPQELVRAVREVSAGRQYFPEMS